jgi:hypothetical protein
VVRIADKERPEFPSLQSLSRLTGSGKVYFLECLQGVVLRNRMRHLEAARWHPDFVFKPEKKGEICDFDKNEYMLFVISYLMV